MESKGLMDIAFNHRTIDAGLAAFLDVFVFGMHQQIPRKCSHVSGEILLMLALRADFPNPLSAMPIRQNRLKARESSI
jgi:hypothetical protein